MINPSVGRKVWYRPNERDLAGTTGDSPDTGKMITNGKDPLDATIIAVWGPRLVNVSVTDIHGTHHARRSVILRQEGDIIQEWGRYVEWMPYQVGQAKKDDANKEAAK